MSDKPKSKVTLFLEEHDLQAYKHLNEMAISIVRPAKVMLKITGADMAKGEEDMIAHIKKELGL